MTAVSSSTADLAVRLAALGVVPVVAIHDAADAPALARALVDGGLPVAEITFRTDAADEAIRRISDARPDVLVGAGTVLSPEAVDRAVSAGAAFVVAPGLNPAVVERCLEQGIPVVPGVNNPTQVEQALDLGLDTLKFFPAVPSGGIPMLAALAGPYPAVRFMPTGGVTASSAPEWLGRPNVVAVGGTWVAPSDDIAAGRFDSIAESARSAAGLRAATPYAGSLTETSLQ